MHRKQWLRPRNGARLIIWPVLCWYARLGAFSEAPAGEVLEMLAYRLSRHTEIVSAEAFALGIARHVAQEQNGRKDQIQNVDHTFFDNVSAPTVTLSNEEEIVRM